MRTIAIKAAISAATLLGLLMLVGDMPEAGLASFVAAKSVGAAIIILAVKAWDKYIPDEESI